MVGHTGHHRCIAKRRHLRYGTVRMASSSSLLVTRWIRGVASFRLEVNFSAVLRASRRLLLASVVLGAASPRGAQAQAQPETGRAIRWRVAADSDFSYGKLVGASSSSLSVEPRFAASAITLRRQALYTIQISGPARGRSVAIDAGLGGAIGGLVGFVAGQGHGRACDKPFDCASGETVISLTSAGV